MPSSISRQEAARELLRRETATESLLSFTCYTKPDYQVSWHHQLICEAVDSLVAGDLTRLMVFVHPRSGKSEICSRRLPAYILGRNPDLPIIATSYSSDLAGRMNRDVQRIIDSDSYHSLFPLTNLFGKNVRTLARGTWMRNSDFFEVVGRQGSYRSAGVGAGITGMGAGLIIVDDYLKSAAEARSDTIREGQWEWFINDLYTRQQPGCRILIICTRWHHDDIPGRLLKLQEDDASLTPWTVLRLPAIAEAQPHHPADGRKPGEALWPDRFPLAWLLQAKAQMGAHNFGALYQQDPTPREGALFPRSCWRIVPVLPAGVRWTWARYWDKGYSVHGDWTVGVLIGRTDDGRFFVADRQRIRATPRERNQHIINTASTDRTTRGHVRTYIEQPPGAGVETTDTLIRQLAGYPVQAVVPRGDKEERAEAAADQCEAGNVYLLEAPWNKQFMDELEVFPAGENDDTVDSFSGGFLVVALPQDLCPGKAIDVPPRTPTWASPVAATGGRDREQEEERPQRRFFGRR